MENAEWFPAIIFIISKDPVNLEPTTVACCNLSVHDMPL